MKKIYKIGIVISFLLVMLFIASATTYYSDQTIRTTGTLNSSYLVGNNDWLQLKGNMNLSDVDTSLRFFSKDRDLFSEGNPIELYAVENDSKPFIAWYDRYNRGVGWFGCHELSATDLSNNNGNHSHCSIETWSSNDSVDDLNTRFEVSYGRPLDEMFVRVQGVNDFILSGSGENDGVRLQIWNDKSTIYYDNTSGIDALMTSSIGDMRFKSTQDSSADYYFYQGTSPNDRDHDSHIRVYGNGVSEEYVDIYHGGTDEAGVFESKKGDLKLKLDGKTIFVIDNNTGNVGINILDPEQELHIKGSGNVIARVTDNSTGVDMDLRADQSVGWVGTDTNHELRLMTNGKSAVYIDTAGSVGIGKTPSLALDVNGSINASNRLYTYNLTIKGTFTPSSAQDACVIGTLTADDNYLYYCNSTSEWVRASLSSW